MTCLCCGDADEDMRSMRLPGGVLRLCRDCWINLCAICAAAISEAEDEVGDAN